MRKVSLNDIREAFIVLETESKTGVSGMDENSPVFLSSKATISLPDFLGESGLISETPNVAAHSGFLTRQSKTRESIADWACRYPQISSKHLSC